MARQTRRRFLQATGAVTGSMFLSSGVGSATSAGANVAFASENAWPTPGGTIGNTRATHAAGPTGPYLQTRWKVSESLYSPGSPTVANGIVYFSGTPSDGGEEGAVFAYDTTSGERLWKQDNVPTEFRLPSESGANGRLGDPNSQPIVYGGSLYISCDGMVPPYSGDGLIGVYSLNATTGEIQWRRADLGTPVIGVTNDRVYFGSGALDAATGQSIWEIDSQEQLIGVDGSTLYTRDWDSASQTTVITARDATTGTKQWQVRRDLGGIGRTSITSEAIYVTSHSLEEESSLTVYALYTTDGSIKWQSPAPARGTAPIIEYSLNGTEEHTYIVDRDPYISAPAVDESRLYVLTRTYTDDIIDPVEQPDGEYLDSYSTLYAFDRFTGDELWRFETAAQALAAPTMADDTVYFICRYHDFPNEYGLSWGTPAMYALDTRTGAKSWVSAIDADSDSFITAPTVVDKSIFLTVQPIGEYPVIYALESTQCGESIPDDGSQTVRNDPATTEKQRTLSRSGAARLDPDSFPNDVEPLVSRKTHPANTGTVSPPTDHSLLSPHDFNWRSPLAFVSSIGASAGAYLTSHSLLR